MKIYLYKFLASLLICVIFFPSADADAQTPYGNNDAAGDFISVDGANIYYEVYGEGRPLVLIHGNGGSIAYMAPQIEFFSKNYKVLIVDCRGRGKSDLGPDTLTYMQMTKDIVMILDHLGYDSTYVVGRSDGAIIALMMAIYYPEKVSKAVAFSANITYDSTAFYPKFYYEVINDRKYADKMIALNDTTRNWKIIQQRNRLMEFQPDIPASDLHKIKCPLFVMSCDRDIIREEHTVFIYRNICKANLCIFPGENHYVTQDNPTLFNATVAKFLNEPFRGDEIRE